MKKLLMIVLIILITSGCATTNKVYNAACKRYVPMTEGDFRIALFRAMIEKSYAGYSLGLSELVILQTLKDDFQFYYVSHALGDAKNSALDSGRSCSEALNSAYSNESYFNSIFQEHALSAMKEGQIMMIKQPAQAAYANKILSEHPVGAIKNADKRYREEVEFLKKINENQRKK